MRVLGFDIGGANLKAADNEGRVGCRPFALWKEPQRLPAELRTMRDELTIRPMVDVDRIAVTMTAELCDCFATKAEGVEFILSAVESIAGETPILVWQTGGEFLPPDVAREIPRLVAAANWHALATFCGRMVPRETALLIDVGSTTTDMIPLQNGVPTALGMTDFERLKSGELVYTGVRRTPVAAVANRLAWQDEHVGLSAELFATMLDVYLILGELPEDPSNFETANGRPATIAAARDRLARMLCCDRTELSSDQLAGLARQLADRQCRQIAHSLENVFRRLPEAPRTIIVSGEGAFLAERAISTAAELRGAERVSLTQTLGAKLSVAACAFSVAKLASEAP